MASRYLDLPAVVLEPGIRSGMPILYDNPRQVGPDRIANAVGAFDLYGGPTVVVDFGTATTIDATSAAGEYLGGAILPGIEISLDALFDRAAALSWVELVPPSGSSARTRRSRSNRACCSGSRPPSTACAGASRPSWGRA